MPGGQHIARIRKVGLEPVPCRHFSGRKLHMRVINAGLNSGQFAEK
jgi:hypothetical protein